MKQRYIIEFLIAASVIAVLFIVMFPNFQKAQHTAGVAKSLHDLSEIAKALETYNQQIGDKAAEVHSLSIRDPGEDAEPEVWVYTVHEFNSRYNEYENQRPNPFSANHANAEKAIRSQLNFDYRPPQSMLLLNGHTFKNNYVVETGVWRKYCIRAGYQPNHYFIVNRLETFPFDNAGELPIVGVARGPFFDAHIGEKPHAVQETRYSFFSGHPSVHSSRIANDAHFAEYNPTNGIRSHGYVVYRSPAGQVADITAYIQSHPSFRFLNRPNAASQTFN